MLRRLTTMMMIAIFTLMAFAATPAAAQDDDGDYTYLRVTHLSYDSGPVAVYIDGQPSDLQELMFGDISGWAEMAPGTYSVAFVPLGGSMEEAVLGPFNYELEEDAWTTLAVIGSAEDGTDTVQPLRMNYSEINAGEARIAVFHALSGAPAVDLRLDDGTVLVEDLPFATNAPESFEAGMATFSVAAGTYNLQLVPTGETEPVLLTIEDLSLEAGTFYFVSVSGTPDEPVPVFSSLAVDDLREMTNAPFDDGDDMDETGDTEDTDDDTDS